MPTTPFEVYVHVPFCLRRCGYCDFNTYTAADLGGGASRRNYADLAIREMRLVRAWQAARGIEEPRAASVFFGGGTPTILPARDLNRMLAAIRELWGLEPGAEVTSEANPDTVDAGYVRELADGGFTRLSFGMQSAVPHVLATLDRTHTPANVEAGVRAARAAGLDASVDLIYGAPGESLDDWRASVRAAIDLGTDHVSAYALTVEPTTAMGRRIAAGTLPRPDDDDEAAKYEIADGLLAAAGLRWYEVSNWARPGYESRHNLGYWRNVDWAGIGPGAHSHYRAVAGATDLFPDADVDGADDSEGFRPVARAGGAGEGGPRPEGVAPGPAADPAAAPRGLRAWDLAHPRRWAAALAAGRVPWADGEAIGPEADLEERVMLGIRLREGLETAGLPAPPDPAVVEGLVADGLVVRHGTRLVPTLRGRLLNDLVIERLLG
ncbi:radical SAM family heme chaperone HemW [Bifidobacterium pullorum]|nr:radical SAM family heme chaperone HemW [Bifidobacterium pullorum]